MNKHPYLRAYMAGILLPTWVLLLGLVAFLFFHYTHRTSARLETVLVFPAAVVPNLWGVWNVLYRLLGLRSRGISLGVFGALLPLILVPAGFALAGFADLDFYTVRQATIMLPIAMTIYYLVWKYAVAFFNRVVDPA